MQDLRRSDRADVERLLRGDPRALARLITRVEGREPGYERLLDELHAHTGRSHRLGVTGPPGVGKSTLVDRLTRRLRAQGRTVGVLACDPSSPFTGGALLGDRIRMKAVSDDEGVFIRSLATRGSLGGLARAAGEVAWLMEAYGFDYILLETIGAGQAEIDVVQAADTVVVVLVPQSGDVVQAMKAGLMEIADVFVVNKCDQPGAQLAVDSLEQLLSLAPRPRPWTPPIVRAVASEDRGTDDLMAALEAHRAHLAEGERLTARRRARLAAFIRRTAEERLHRELWGEEQEEALRALVEEVLLSKRSPYEAAWRLLETLPKSPDRPPAPRGTRGSDGPLPGP